MFALAEEFSAGREKVIAECNIFNRTAHPLLWGTDCDASAGASGGALLDTNVTEPAILAILVATSNSEKGIVEPKQQGRPDRKRFDYSHGATYFVPLRFYFVRAVLDAHGAPGAKVPGEDGTSGEEKTNDDPPAPERKLPREPLPARIEPDDQIEL
ncbi:hypothetical protein [Methyloceanibacter sp.]|uniref:hypothetical protein n=1 Tax=Methyloceanibacter sp. TaxID=1965321 RepID=UPI003D6CD542